MTKANVRMFACSAYRSMVDWMNAFKRAASKKSMYVRPGDACASKACCDREGTRRYRARTHFARQPERLEGLADGSRTLVIHPPDTVDLRLQVLGGQQASNVTSRACDMLLDLSAAAKDASAPLDMWT